MSPKQVVMLSAAILLSSPVFSWAQSTSGGSTRTTGGSTSGSATSSAASSQATSSLGGGTGASAAGGGPGGGGSGGVQGPQFTEFGQVGASVGTGFVGRGNNSQGFVGASGAGQQSVDAGGTARFSGLGGGGGNARGGGQAATSQTRGSQMRVSQRLSFPVPSVPATVVSGNVSNYFSRTPSIGGGVTLIADDAGHVVLQGSVADDHARKLAEALVRLEPGVREVTNELQVTGTADSSTAPPQLGR